MSPLRHFRSATGHGTYSISPYDLGLCLIAQNAPRVKMDRWPSEIEAFMRHQSLMHYQRSSAIALLVVSLLLFTLQAGLWAKATAHARSETDKQNMEVHHPPNEIPGLAGMFLLVAGGVIAMIPATADRE
jgi:hypothetical protein